MTTLRDIFPALAPESLERSPHLPLAHRQILSAIPQCQSGHDGHRLSHCHHCGGQHRVKHACGQRHGPPCQQHTTPPWLHHPLDHQLPGPPFLRTCPGPATRRPGIRSHQRRASHALLHASAPALKRLATDERFIGTDLPGCTGVLHPWGRQLQDHPHLPAIVPGGGLAEDRTTWGPSRAHCWGPVQALSPISRALCQADRRQAGCLAQIDPQVWTIPWNVHAQAKHHGHAACTSLAPSVCKGALATQRILSLQDHTVTVTSRQGGRARLRTPPLDVSELIRRFLHHVLPASVQQVRHCGLLHASCAIPLATIHLMRMQGHPGDAPLPPRTLLPPHAARCPTWGAPMRVIMRRWTSPRDVVDTGGEA